jgi:hypothetical protein
MLLEKLIIKNFFIILFVVCLFFLTVSSDSSVAGIWLLTALPFYPLLKISVNWRHETFKIFILFSFLAHSAGSAFFFMYKEIYTPTGWAAVGNFSFDILEYLEIYKLVFAFFFFTALSLWIYSMFWKFNLGLNNLTTIQVQTRDKVGIKIYSYALVLFLLFMFFLNYVMFLNGIGITGISPPSLPFKLSGILYFFSRFIAPVLALYLYSRTSRNVVLSSLIMVYAVWAGLSQVSRTTFTMFFIPIFFFSVVDKRSIRLVVYMLLFFSILPLIEIARNFVYAYEDDTAVFNSSLSFFEVIMESLNFDERTDFVRTISGFVGRLGGAQDVVLAYQYENPLGTSLLEFERVFLLSSEMDMTTVVYELFGFTPVLGFSPGDGALSAAAIVISGGNYFVLFLVSSFVALLIHCHEFLIGQIPRIYRSKELVYFLAILFCIILVPRLNNLWLYGYLVLLFFGVIGLKIKFIQKTITRYFGHLN